MRFFLILIGIFRITCSKVLMDVHTGDLETIKLMPRISGVRVENGINEKGFISYDTAGRILVEPNVDIRVIIFGYWLNLIGLVTFTRDTCLHPVISHNYTDFLTHTNKVIELHARFPASDIPYRICWREKLYGRPYEEDLLFENDEQRTWIKATYDPPEHFLPREIQYVIIAILFGLSALCSGLNLGLMSLNETELNLIIKSGSKKEQKFARKILPVRKAGNQLLCSILLTNVIVNVGIAILMGEMLSGLAAFFISSFGIVLIGEIIPQSVCIKNGLAVGAHTILLTRMFMILTFPLSYPIGKLLDWILGEEITSYDKNELIALMKFTPKWEQNKELAEDLKIAVGAMEITEKTVRDVMTHIEDVFMIPEETVLNNKNLSNIIKKGYSRIPVYANGNRNQIVSLLFIKDLALLDPEDEFTAKTIGEYNKHPMRFIPESKPCHTMLNEFKAGNYHLAFVVAEKSNINNNEKQEILGIITLEDIVEEILQAEIIDEYDMVVDNKYKRRRKFHGKHNQDNTIPPMHEYTEPCKNITNALCKTITNWLQNHSKIFSPPYLDNRALRILVNKNIHEVELPQSQQLLDAYRHSTPNIVQLYTKGEISRRFILIIEGRATAFFKNSDLKFRVGPWEFFGNEVLNSISQYIKEGKFENSVRKLKDEENLKLGEFIPDFDLVVKDHCKYLQITVPTYLNAFKVTDLATYFKGISKSETTNANGKKLSITNQNLSRRPISISKDHIYNDQQQKLT